MFYRWRHTQIYLFLPVVLLVSCNNAKITVKESHENYTNGNAKWVKRVTVKQNKHTQRDANYVRTTTEFRSFYDNGTLYMHWKLVEDMGPDNSCDETLFEVKQYHSNGKKSRIYKMECDCHKEHEKTYNEKGKVLTKKKAVVKRLY